MAGSSTVPSDHTQLPQTPDDSQAFVSKEQNATIVQKANNTARNKLAQKNRKQNEFKIDLPITLQFEASTAYSISGFTPDADQGTWIVVESEIHISGKRGSETRVTFQRAIDF
jgi:hypothetical protein